MCYSPWGCKELDTTEQLNNCSCLHGGSDGKESACNSGDSGSIPGLGAVRVPITVLQEVPSGVLGSNGLGGNTFPGVGGGADKLHPSSLPHHCSVIGKNKSDSKVDLFILHSRSASFTQTSFEGDSAKNRTVKLLQEQLLCCVSRSISPILCDPTDSSPPGSSLSTEASMQEYWSGLPFPPPRDLPNPGIESGSPALQVDV